jgi:hypothetical protein
MKMGVFRVVALMMIVPKVSNRWPSTVISVTMETAGVENTVCPDGLT